MRTAASGDASMQCYPRPQRSAERGMKIVKGMAGEFSPVILPSSAGSATLTYVRRP